MYSLRVVATDRRMSHVPLSKRSAVGGLDVGSEDVEDDDLDDEETLLGLDLSEDTPAIEFTAGNPRVEHITGVVHLYRPTPGRPAPDASLPATATRASGAVQAPDPTLRASVTASTHETAAPTTSTAAATTAAAAAAAAAPSKGSATAAAPPTWASLLAPPNPKWQQQQQQQQLQQPIPPLQQPPHIGLDCDQLCCLALPIDMTIADFCTFLGAHLLRLRQMRVLRRQVAPVGWSHGPHAPGPSLGHATPNSASSGSSAAVAAAAAAAAAAPAAAPTATPTASVPGRPGMPPAQQPGRAGPGSGPKRAAASSGPPDPDRLADRNPSATNASGTACHRAHRQHDGASAAPPGGPRPAAATAKAASLPSGTAAQTAAAAAAPQPSVRPHWHPPPQPPPQRVVCMVVMRMESPAAAAELYNDLNGKPFSSLEPDIMCRMVYVSAVEVTSGRSSTATPASTSTPTPIPASTPAPEPRHGSASDQGGSGTAPPPPPPPPPPGQTELPTCPVCLERLDEHVSGIVTTVCNHMFHSECLQRWADSSCPVCRYCVQGAANSSKCAVCATAADLWICLICGHVGCGRYRAGHAADHWRTSGHCYALELETQRVWDYVGDNYVHRLIQSKTDGKLVELAAPATAASPHAARGGSSMLPPGALPTHGSMGPACGSHAHHGHAGHDTCAAAHAGATGGLATGNQPDSARGGGGRGGWGQQGYGSGDGRYGAGGGASGSAGGGAGWTAADEDLKEALIASKLDAIAAEYNHLLACQLDSQRQYYEGLLAQATQEADHRVVQSGAAADKAAAEAADSAAAAREEARRRQAAERKAAEAAEALKALKQESDFLRSLNDTLLANQRDLKQQLAAEKARTEAAEAAAKDLQEQVRDLAFFIEAQKTISDAAGGELKEGTLLPLPQAASGSRGGGRGSGARGGGGGSRGAK